MKYFGIFQTHLQLGHANLLMSHTEIFVMGHAISATQETPTEPLGKFHNFLQCTSKSLYHFSQTLIVDIMFQLVLSWACQDLRCHNWSCPGRVTTVNVQNWNCPGRVRVVNVQNWACPGRVTTVNVLNWSCPGRVRT